MSESNKGEKDMSPQIAEKKLQQEQNEEKKKGLVVGSSFDFLFEKENDEYDKIYKDYIKECFR